MNSNASILEGSPEITELEGAPVEQKAPEPRVVWGLGFYLAFQFFFACLGLFLWVVNTLVTIPTVSAGADPWGLAFHCYWGLGAAYYAGMSFKLPSSLSNGGRRAWAVTFVLLFCRALSGCLVAVPLCFASAQSLNAYALMMLSLAGILGGWSLGHGLLLRALYRSREWFGMGRGEGWRVARREAGVAWVAGILFEVVPALLVVGLSYSYRR